MGVHRTNYEADAKRLFISNGTPHPQNPGQITENNDPIDSENYQNERWGLQSTDIPLGSCCKKKISSKMTTRALEKVLSLLNVPPIEIFENFWIS